TLEDRAGDLRVGPVDDQRHGALEEGVIDDAVLQCEQAVAPRHLSQRDQLGEQHAAEGRRRLERAEYQTADAMRVVERVAGDGGAEGPTEDDHEGGDAEERRQVPGLKDEGHHQRRDAEDETDNRRQIHDYYRSCGTRSAARSTAGDTSPVPVPI